MKKLKFFIPEWDDLVYDQYDYATEQRLSGSKRVYAHEIFPNRIYDGILLSKVKIEENKTKYKQISDHGAHHYLRFDGPIFGDCGAWGYYKEKVPPYTTKEVLRYYKDIKVDLGVSVDHLTIASDQEENHFRLELTKTNAEKFIHQWQEDDYSFTPVGAIQGWDPESYKESLLDILDLNYEYIAIGGVAKTQTEQLLSILKTLKPIIEKENAKREQNLDIHLFGVSRLRHVDKFMQAGITSFDSASELRKSWLSARQNYSSVNYQGYTAIRLPLIRKNKLGTRYRKILDEGLATLDELMEAEENLLSIMKAFEHNESTAHEVAEAFQMFEDSINPKAPSVYSRYRATLEDKPWEQCDCAACRQLGIDIIIFRGNNRNRNRGFHNLHIFYTFLQRVIQDPSFQVPEKIELDTYDYPHGKDLKKKKEDIKEAPKEPSAEIPEEYKMNEAVKRKLIKKRKTKKKSNLNNFFDEL
ncbi:MAG: hypothetical protein INQ03_22105 [Candidatus Heimdallarchaeota archaeon]|nr:hypothetical protein [Candidatus Heimdallarchaeota archaeon]